MSIENLVEKINVKKNKDNFEFEFIMKDNQTEEEKEIIRNFIFDIMKQNNL